jgi:protease IV
MRMKKSILSFGLLCSLNLYSVDTSWAYLAREVIEGLKELNQDNEKYQKVMTRTAVGLAMVPIMHRAYKKIKEMVKTMVGVIEIKGGIFTAEHYVRQLDEFSKRSDIAGILLKIDSPGGSPGAAEALHNELKLFREKKPVVVLVENICASAAYYIASAANYIIANPSSMVGSIGVYMPLTYYEGLPQEYSIGFNGSIATIKDQTVQAGEFKRVGNPFKKLNDKEHDYIQKHIDEAYDIFTMAVADNRSLSLEERSTWAEGRIFNGKHALSMNLIDEVGSISNARMVLQQLITTKGGTARSDIHFVKPYSLLDSLMSWVGIEHSSADISHIVAKMTYQIQERIKQYKSLQNIQIMS